MTPPLLLAVGGAHVDRRGRLAGPQVPGASNPGAMREEVGGGAFNALRVAAARGVSGALVSLRGGDAAGTAVAEAAEAAGIADLSAVFLDRATPSYTAILDHDGELITAIADMGLYEAAFCGQLARRKFRAATARADALLIDANVPAAAIDRAVATAAEKPVFAIAISPAKAARLAAVVERLACGFMNAREAHVLAGTTPGAGVAAAAARLRERGLAAGMITQGAAPLVVFDRAGLLEIAPGPARVADVTGAGDALAGAAIAALLTGADFVTAARHGLAAARLAVESEAAAPHFSAADFEAALALVGEPCPVP